MAPPALRSAWSTSRTRPARLIIPITTVLAVLCLTLRYGAFPGPGDTPMPRMTSCAISTSVAVRPANSLASRADSEEVSDLRLVSTRVRSSRPGGLVGREGENENQELGGRMDVLDSTYEGSGKSKAP